MTAWALVTGACDGLGADKRQLSLRSMFSAICYSPCKLQSPKPDNDKHTILPNTLKPKTLLSTGLN